MSGDISFNIAGEIVAVIFTLINKNTHAQHETDTPEDIRQTLIKQWPLAAGVGVTVIVT